MADRGTPNPDPELEAMADAYFACEGTHSVMALLIEVRRALDAHRSHPLAASGRIECPPGTFDEATAQQLADRTVGVWRDESWTRMDLPAAVAVDPQLATDERLAAIAKAFNDETARLAAVDPSPPEPENIAVEWDEERQQYIRIPTPVAVVGQPVTCLACGQEHGYGTPHPAVEPDPPTDAPFYESPTNKAFRAGAGSERERMLAARRQVGWLHPQSTQVVPMVAYQGKCAEWGWLPVFIEEGQ